MALTQSGIITEGPNKPFMVVDNIPRPSPGPKQVLVKCLAVGINPVDPMQQHTGLLVKEWPAILGSDCAGVVIETGSNCTRLKKGDYVYGCAPLGQNKLTPYQETFLVEESVFLNKNAKLSIEAVAGTSVGLLTAALSLLAGTNLQLPSEAVKSADKDEWIVILGGSGTVGQFAVQIARLCGYKVLASCSASKQSIPLGQGATQTFDNRAPIEEQLAAIEKTTNGNFARIFDSTAHGYELMVKALETCSKATTKYLSTVDDWSEFNTPSAIKEYRTELGLLCRPDDPIGAEVTRNIAGWIPTLEKHLAAGTLSPIEYRVVDGVGWNSVIQGLEDLENGKVAKKIVARVANE